MSIKAINIARANSAGHAAMLADGHRGAWQVQLDAKPSTFVVETFTTSYVTNPKGNRAWGPPSA
ncbi:hypothetical protein Back2_07490 [Nocardioides baekrokdamisoli]|uniref:Uncharacterized protein n=1 Tax=Nocardioides baekrokdamisoli TaxID=1804624 RepID=A0A3G9IDL5_9ACTN|nr:hypothetical protein [Nocardioides baekrokdamisoli]BBH16462.1 hypothetical protein Back2_07490 [Nocardioides baekrokdamisoli]